MRYIQILRAISQSSKPTYSKTLAPRIFTRGFRMTTPLSKEPRRFAPLKEGIENTGGAPRLKGIVFDVDGTLW